MADVLPTSFSFAGCGFLGIYHAGVVACLEEHVPECLGSASFGGASAGALVACCLICKVPLGTSLDCILSLVTEAYQYNLGVLDPKLPVNALLKKALDEILPPDAHTLCSGRLHVSVTKLRSLNVLAPQTMMTNEIVSEFPTRDYLIETLLISSYIPVLSGQHNPVLDKEIAMDGAFSNNMPRLDMNTILVCPFAGDTHISPRDPDLSSADISTHFGNSIALTVDNLKRVFDGFFLPESQQLFAYYKGGYDDTLAFLLARNLIRCEEHRVTSLEADQANTVEECQACQDHVAYVVRYSSPPHQQKFEVVVKDLQEKSRHRACPAFSLLELVGVFMSMPLETLRLLPCLVKINAAIIRGNLSILKSLVFRRQLRGLLEEWLGSMRDEGTLITTILFRTNTLLAWKLGTLLLTILGYVTSTRVCGWGKMLVLPFF